VSSFPPTSILNTRLKMKSVEMGRVYLFTAFQTIDPEMRGTMCVKLKPESMTNMHSGGDGASPFGVWSGAVNNEPWGISDAAGYERDESGVCVLRIRNARTGAPVV
jgi:hypothetical protein